MNAKRIAKRIVTAMWRDRLQDNYDGDFESWEHYSDTYGLAERLGFSSAKEAWDANPLIQGSTDPRDFRVVEEGTHEHGLAQWEADMRAAERAGNEALAAQIGRNIERRRRELGMD